MRFFYSLLFFGFVFSANNVADLYKNTFQDRYPLLESELETSVVLYNLLVFLNENDDRHMLVKSALESHLSKQSEYSSYEKFIIKSSGLNLDIGSSGSPLAFRLSGGGNVNFDDKICELLPVTDSDLYEHFKKAPSVEEKIFTFRYTILKGSEYSTQIRNHLSETWKSDRPAESGYENKYFQLMEKLGIPHSLSIPNRLKKLESYYYLWKLFQTISTEDENSLVSFGYSPDEVVRKHAFVYMKVVNDKLLNAFVHNETYPEFNTYKEKAIQELNAVVLELEPIRKGFSGE